MRVLITGISGFAGSHLADYIIANHEKHEIHGLVRPSSNLNNINDIKNKTYLHSAKLSDSEQITAIIRKVQPDRIFHLAGQSMVMQSFEDPISTFQTNVIGTLNLLEAIRQANIDPVVMVCSSSEIYGQVREDGIPITENTAFYPVNPYGVSKLAMDRLSFQYFQSYGMKTVIIRAFPHTGPRRNSAFAESSFAKQLVEIENGADNTVTVGNLDSVRTFLDVRDMVDAYWQATEKCDFGGAYNVGGETPLTINELLSSLVKLSKVNVSIKTDVSLLRPKDASNHIPDTTKFKKQTGWNPKISLEQTLADLLNYWRVNLHK